MVVLGLLVIHQLGTCSWVVVQNQRSWRWFLTAHSGSCYGCCCSGGFLAWHPGSASKPGSGGARGCGFSGSGTCNSPTAGPASKVGGGIRRLPC
ncbi:hypothetical protein BD289DRAFT_425841 [Coniella lustricola]|uniref:Secreted protein n=1 Tax=Coniella lustricola TaxID=2025994 RepID=A0A2T3AH65_9PEZI|nr:hypothetical protein BD289DRAFT_425841 [Coniella lustricola]